jgi:MFS family permease
VPSVVDGTAAGGRLLTPAFVALTVSELAYFTSIGAMFVVLPVFGRDALGLDPLAIGVAVGIFSVVALLLRPAAGRVADRWGRRRLLLAGAVLFTLTVAAHLLVTAYPVLLALRALLGVAEAAYFVAGMAVLADIAPPDRLGEALSYNSLGLYLGITMGPALGEWLLGVGGFAAAWAGAAALGAVATVVALQVPVTGLPAGVGVPPGSGGTRAGLLPPGVVGPGAAFVAGLAGAAGFLAFAALYAPRVGLPGAGGVLFVYGAVVVVSRILLGRYMDAFPAAVLSAGALALCAAGLAVMAGVRSPGGLVAGAAVLAFGVAFLTPAFFRVLVERAGPRRRSGAAAAFSIMVDLGLGGGPILWGLVASVADLAWAMTVSAGAAAVAAVLVALAAARAPAPAGRPDAPPAAPREDQR